MILYINPLTYSVLMKKLLMSITAHVAYRFPVIEFFISDNKTCLKDETTIMCSLCKGIRVKQSVIIEMRLCIIKPQSLSATSKSQC